MVETYGQDGVDVHLPSGIADTLAEFGRFIEAEVAVEREDLEGHQAACLRNFAWFDAPRAAS